MFLCIILFSRLQSSRSLKGDHVPSFMILPIQRVPRYKLLLEGVVYTACQTHMYFISYSVSFTFIDYLKHLPEGHPDIVNTKGKCFMMYHAVFNYLHYTAALVVISETALHMNSTIVDLVGHNVHA